MRHLKAPALCPTYMLPRQASLAQDWVVRKLPILSAHILSKAPALPLRSGTILSRSLAEDYNIGLEDMSRVIAECSQRT
jgi:hypothetical protein